MVRFEPSHQLSIKKQDMNLNLTEEEDAISLLPMLQ
jgi:hypothetical protein